MTLNKYLLSLDLQQFGDGEDDDQSGEDALAAAIKSLLDSDGGTDDDDDEDVDENDDKDDDDSDADEDEDETDDSDSDDDQDDELDDDDDNDSQKTDPKKKQQSKEENAKFAKERREREAKERAEAELERLKQESPEFQLAKMLSDEYGQPVDVIMEQLKEAKLQKEAQETKVPVEVLRKQRESEDRAANLEKEIAMLKFQNWQTNIKADGQRLMGEYKMLTQEDMDAATDYILNVAKNVEMPLEDAVFAIHGKKIVDALAKGKVQDELANQSGRKRKTPPSPNNSKTKKVIALSADEQAIAKAFGMSDEEYDKYKS